MFSSKRQDKYTTGLINTRNDCFANSSIQAFAALPGLDLYLNDILKQYHKFSLLSLAESEERPLPTLPLHEALATIVKELQEPIISKKHVSVWPFLNVIEKIFNSKISTNQNDAHELVQLILETLDNESSKFKKFVKSNGLQQIQVPNLPFNGIIADQLTCHFCLNSSKPSFHPFSVFTMPVPQSTTASLTDMIKNSEVETITGYNCLRCKLKAILKLEADKITEGVSISEEHAQVISKLKIMEPNLTINDDLEEDLEAFIKNYTYKGFKSADLQSTIVKKTLVVKAPDILTVHLSRSMFTSNHITRNGCKVEFEDVIKIDIDDNLVLSYEEKLRAARRARKLKDNRSILSDVPSSVQYSTTNHKNNNEAGDELDSDASVDGDVDGYDGYDDDRNEPAQLARIHSKILASHEEVAEEPQHDENATTTTTTSSDGEDEQSNSDKVHSNSTDVTSLEGDVIEDGDSDDDSIHSNLSEDLNISKENAKYKLRAVIRHQGTHNAGHYECFRHKPLLVKDTVNDKIVNLSPVIDLTFENSDSDPTPTPTAPDKKATTNTNISKNGYLSPPPSNGESISRNSASGEDSEDTGFSKFRNRIGSFVSRRSSVSQGTSSRRNSIIGGSNGISSTVSSPRISQQQPASDPHANTLSSVAENTNGNRNENGNTNEQVNQIVADLQNFELNTSKTSKDKRFKKISSVAKYPYWRISDTQITEVRSHDVLREKAGVYMLYYERVKTN